MKTVYESPDRGQTIRERPFRQPIGQVKSNWYYVFWGIMAAAVCGGQLYVGLGYREMAKASKAMEISVACVTPYDTPQQQDMRVSRTKPFE
jgi:hypothetical protein